MMATEATSDILAPSSSTIPDHELNTTETAIQDDSLEPEQALVNGNTEKEASKPDAEPAEPVLLSAEVSVSGGSDTEASKAETSKTTGDEKGHARTTSTIKKFASFKPVSVNKTFLAAKGATSATPSKLGDKAATATSQTSSLTAVSRPRLVAKSASGVRDSSPRTSSSANGGVPGAAPDASAVWNKNRPTAPPEPKRFTDEELKQRYGIHLATRLQSDDPGKQANWADIDDDDEDWAPETIEWTDGTKITLPQAEDPATIREPSPIPAVKEAKAIEAMKPKSPAPTQSSASPTIKPSGFGGRTGLILKGGSDKPTLVAKPPGPPTPVKSPWAPLPPVDKVAPLPLDIPHNQHSQPSRFDQKDRHGFHGMPPPPAKEIAADDFSRSSWRESHGGNSNRTLFNSQSGGYEPVNDNRRGSRNDASNRGPAVLQRPSQQDGPAEPSPAFQTHRASGLEGGYGRRRTSSNVSGGSGNFIRRMSRGHDMPPPHEMLSARRGSLAAVSDAPSSPRNFSPSGQHPNQRGYQNQQHWQSRASPVVSHPSPQSVSGQPILAETVSGDGHAQPPVLFEDPVEEQKKIMRASRELAIKRRQEQEAAEEAAKKERLRLKLEAMGPAPEKKKDKKDVAKEEKPVPTQIQTRESDGLPAAKPDLSGEPKAKTLDRVDLQQANSVDRKQQNMTEHPPSLEARPNGLHHQHGPGAIGQGPAVTSNQGVHEGRVWQNASASGQDRYQSWAPPSTQQSSSRNVWGPPPSNERPLGNGTFNPDLSRLPDSQPSAGHPGPIAPPNRDNGRGRDYGPRPNPIAPPTRQSTASREQQARVAASGWADLPQKLAREDAQSRQQVEADNARKRELKAAGLLPEEPQPIYKDTWRKVTLNEDGTRSKVQESIPTVHEPTAQWTPQEDNNARPGYEERRNDVSQPQFNDAWKPTGMTASPQVRGSRFFPNNNRDVRLDDLNLLSDRAPSPPPPTMEDHPAYDGDIAHPHVSLPRPSVVVKLPPTFLPPISRPTPLSFAAAVNQSAPAPPPVHIATTQSQFRQNTQDVRNDHSGPENWQDRISSLLGRPQKGSPKSNALAVDSSSKHALELPSSQSFATVSLPSSVTGDLAADHGSVISKPAAEECFAEQEMGSLPVVKVPNHAPKAGWELHPPPKVNPRRFPPAAIWSSEAIKFEQTLTEEPDEKQRRPAINVQLPGQDTKKVVRYQARQRSNPKPRGTRNNTRGNSSSHRARGREPSGGFPSPNVDNASVTSSPSSRGNTRGRGRANGANSRALDWTRQSASVQT